MKVIKLAIVDDHSLFRETLAYSMQHDEKWGDIEIIFQASNGIELIEKTKGEIPDVILMDLSMPEMDGIEATGYMRDHYPAVKIIILSMHSEKKFILELVRIGASGYLFKNAELDEVRAAIEGVTEKGFYSNSYMSEAMFKGWAHKKRTKPTIATIVNFNERELEVLRFICNEYTTAEIAGELSLSPRTVEGYREKLLEKTGAKNVAGLAVYAVTNDLVSLDLIKTA